MAELRALLRRPGVLRVLLSALVGRLPEGMAPLAVLLLARDEGGSYATAGVLAAAFAVGAAVGNPFLGRLVDRLGQPPVILGSALARSVAFVCVALLAPVSLALAGVFVLIGGALTPPLEPALRALWPDLVADRHELDAAYEVDASAQELIFVMGPIVVALAVAVGSPALAVHVTWAIGLIGAVGFASAPAARAWRRAVAEQPHWVAAVRAPQIARLLAVGLLVGVALGCLNVTTTAFAEDAGNRDWAGWLLSAWAVGGVFGGLAAAARRWSMAPELRLERLLLVFALLLVPTWVIGSVVLMGAWLAVAGAALAPTLGCVFVLTGSRAAAGAATETFAWLTSSILVGSALGAALAGAITGGADPALHGFGLGAATLLLAAAAWRTRQQPAVAIA